jgi:hypothetical protein
MLSSPEVLNKVVKEEGNLNLGKFRSGTATRSSTKRGKPLASLILSLRRPMIFLFKKLY